MGRKKIIEVKPKGRLKEEAVQKQINDTALYAKNNNYEFEVWTEEQSELASEREIIKWAKSYLKINYGDEEFDKIQKQKAIERTKKHYNKHIKNNKITVFCEFCQEDHTIMQLSYDQNIEKNGRFICIKENGSIVGKRAKTHRYNPYEKDRMKQCANPDCKQIKPFSEFNLDKSRRDGYASRCKVCRSKK